MLVICSIAAVMTEGSGGLQRGTKNGEQVEPVVDALHIKTADDGLNACKLRLLQSYC